eukprot:TRINITY_DN17696_c0_g1_i1.p1 TRINITY_DN17696_c0_g1~~TRINITY_DN17696_c0_g1_i1.p1  ORF type:complete len:215 (-),score=15.94 TRINITY_DN17696_c0_g1_i1:209-853(-)
MTSSGTQFTFDPPILMGDHYSGDDVSTSISASRRERNIQGKNNSSNALTSSTMEELVIQLNERYDATLEVRKSFLEFRTSFPKMARSTSEPSMASCTSHGIPSDPSTPSESGSNPLAPLAGSGCVVMVRDVPCKVGIERMIAELTLLGFGGCYNQLNFPIRTTRGKVSGKGFGFISFVMSRSRHVSFQSLWSTISTVSLQTRKLVRNTRMCRVF